MIKRGRMFSWTWGSQWGNARSGDLASSQEQGAIIALRTKLTVRNPKGQNSKMPMGTSGSMLGSSDPKCLMVR